MNTVVAKTGLAHRIEYYDRLMAIRTNGDWEGWLKFFLRGIFEVSQSATATARSILNLREVHREIIGQQISGSNYGLRLLDFLFQQPLKILVTIIINIF